MTPRKNIKWAEALLSRLIKEEWLEDLLGDLEEYQYDLQQQASWKRNWLFWFHVICCIRPSLLKPFFTSTSFQYIHMFKFNTKLAFRSAKKHPALSLASALTLLCGTVCFQLIFSWLNNEESMNQIHGNYENLSVTAVKTNPNADLTSISLQTMFQMDYSQFPEVEKVAQVHVYQKGEIKLSTPEHDFKGKAMIVDSTFLEMFDFRLISGLPSTLKDPTSILVTEEFAQRMFGSDKPIGQMVELKCDQEGTYQIAGVLADIPTSSSIDFDFLVPRHSQPFWRRIPQEVVLTQPGLDITAFNQKIKELGRANNARFPESELYLIPLKNCYEDSILEASLFSKYGSRETVKILGFIALMIWFITLFGFNNLQLTFQLSLAKNLGIQHVIGGSKRSIIGELITGKVFFLAGGSILSFLIYQGLAPIVSKFLNVAVDHSIAIDALGILLFTGSIVAIATLISILQMSRFHVTKALKGASLKIPFQQRILTVFQYVIATVLIIATAVVFLQLNYMLHKQPGYAYTDVISIDFFEFSRITEDDTPKLEYIKNELSRDPAIAAFGQGDLPLSRTINATSWKRTSGEYDYTTENMMSIAPGYKDVLGLELLEGRFFSDSLDAPNQEKVVINEAAMRYWNIEDIHTTTLSSNTSGRQAERHFHIIGIVKDYHYQHLSHKIKPLVLRYRTYPDDPYTIRFNAGAEANGLQSLERLYSEMNPSGTFEYTSLEKSLAFQYEEEKRLAKIYLSFTLVALVLSSLCLFTFSFYETKRRTKEIGVRKVIGASTSEVFALLIKSFSKTILVAYALAIPMAYYFQSQWISQFENRISVGWWIYAAAGVLLLIAAIVATSYHTSRVSKQNPVNALRYE